jgi:hypothetical protein
VSTPDESERWNNILSLPPIGDLTATKYLELLRHKAPATADDNFIEQLLRKNLPDNVSMIISIGEYDNLDKLAKAADKIMAVRGNNSNNTGAINKVSFMSDSPSFNLEQQLKEMRDSIFGLERSLNTQLKVVNDRLCNIEMRQSYSDNSRYRSSSTHNHQPRSNSRHNGSQNSSLCYYHSNYGAKARGCTQPCNWNKNNNVSPNPVNDLNATGTQMR